jgi:hypothetical protein
MMYKERRREAMLERKKNEKNAVHSVVEADGQKQKREKESEREIKSRLVVLSFTLYRRR